MMAENYYYWIGMGIVAVLLFILLFSIFKKSKKKPEFAPLTANLKKTQSNFSAKIDAMISRRTKIDGELFSKLEEVLIGADVGVQTTKKLLQLISNDVEQSGKQDIRLLKGFLKQELMK